MTLIQSGGILSIDNLCRSLRKTMPSPVPWLHPSVSMKAGNAYFLQTGLQRVSGTVALVLKDFSKTKIGNVSPREVKCKLKPLLKGLSS
jgi:hypothetical protein